MLCNNDNDTNKNIRFLISLWYIKPRKVGEHENEREKNRFIAFLCVCVCVYCFYFFSVFVINVKVYVNEQNIQQNKIQFKLESNDDALNRRGDNML